MAAALRNFTGKNADEFGVFTSETFYRQRGDVRGWPGPTHHRVERPRGPPAPPGGVVAPWPPSGSPSDFVSCREK
jgi:hypothetical protein